MNGKDKQKPPAAGDEDEANWSHDIENRDYYYDDSTGYEKYDPEKDDEDGNSEDKTPVESQ